MEPRSLEDAHQKGAERLFLENYAFELNIDGDWIELKKWRSYYAG